MPVKRAMGVRAGRGIAAGACLLGLLLLFGIPAQDGVARFLGEGPEEFSARSGNAVAGYDESAPDPVRIRIPEIRVEAPVRPLDVDQGGTLQPPSADDRTGWWRDGPEPGERGPSVIVGHVDSRSGPAVFFRLPDLRAGTRVLVDRADGSTAEFTTGRVERYRKDAFPTGEVYGPTSGAELRLITCGGAFDAARGNYRSNVVVFARRSG